MSAQFDDGKDDGALRTIGEVSRALGIKTHVLRYWEQQFPMLEPLKRSGGRRYYRTEDVELIERIDRLVNNEGYTLKGAQQAIHSGKEDGGSEQAPATAETEKSKPVLDQTIDLPSDGGVDAFFGTAPEPEAEVAPHQPDEPSTETDDELADDLMSKAEVVARLKSIRSRLAEAIAA